MKATTEDVLNLNTLKGMKRGFLTPKRYKHPRHFYMGFYCSQKTVVSITFYVVLELHSEGVKYIILIHYGNFLSFSLSY